LAKATAIATHTIVTCAKEAFRVTNLTQRTIITRFAGLTLLTCKAVMTAAGITPDAVDAIAPSARVGIEAFVHIIAPKAVVSEDVTNLTITHITLAPFHAELFASTIGHATIHRGNGRII